VINNTLLPTLTRVLIRSLVRSFIRVSVCLCVCLCVCSLCGSGRPSCGRIGFGSCARRLVVASSTLGWTGFALLWGLCACELWRTSSRQGARSRALAPAARANFSGRPEAWVQSARTVR